MRRGVWVLVTVLIGSMCVSAENADTRDRRHGRRQHFMMEFCSFTPSRSWTAQQMDSARIPASITSPACKMLLARCSRSTGNRARVGCSFPPSHRLQRAAFSQRLHWERKPSSNSASNMSWTGRNLRVSWHGRPVTPLACTTQAIRRHTQNFRRTLPAKRRPRLRRGSMRFPRLESGDDFSRTAHDEGKFSVTRSDTCDERVVRHICFPRRA
jgi:hypothetical protein